MRLSSCKTKELTSVLEKVAPLLEKPIEPLEPPEAATQKRGYRLTTGREVAQILDLYAQGLPANKVAERLGKPHKTVLDVLNRNGVKIRKAPPITPSQAAEIARLYGTGLSIAKVADNIGVSKSAVEKSLKRSGVMRRSRSEAALLNASED
ncbi:hypothetical protein GCM10020360_11960 [Nonlabens tegetincola]